MIKDKIFRWMIYFKRAHGWFALCFAFMNFIIIQYRLLIEKVDFLKDIFPHLWLFAVSFVLIYTPLAVLVGRYDYKKATLRKETECNPYWRRPTWKEKEVYGKVRIDMLESLAKLLEAHGYEEDAETLRVHAKRIKEWIESD